MQNKKRLHKHLLMIYIIYFAALIVGFAASFVPDFSRGWRNAQNTLEMEIPQGGIRSYYVSAPVIRSAGEPIGIDNLPENITPTISRLDLKVTVDEAYTLGNAFKVMGNNSFCYLLMVITGLSYLTILVLIALIINSLRKSIRDEPPPPNVAPGRPAATPQQHPAHARHRHPNSRGRVERSLHEVPQQQRGRPPARRNLLRSRADISAELLERDRRHSVPLHGRSALTRHAAQRRAETDYLKTT